jgi:hypothetical protein
MPRERLPNRRPNVTVTAAWPLDDGVPLHITLGFDHAGEPKEIFARARKPETHVDCIADDGAVLVSMLLQHGATLAEIAHSLGRSRDGRPTSVVGAIVDIARKVEAEIQGPQLVTESAQ